MSEMLLLGAGASVDAGLPGTFGVTAEIMRKVTSVTAHPDRAALSYLVGGLLFADGVAGADPLSKGVDVEALFRAARRLSHWQDSDIAPFVAAWQPRMIELASLTRPRESVWDITPTDVFGAACLGLTRSLGEILWRKAYPHEYWKPLLGVLAKQRRLTIATLNYDNVLESFMEAHHVPYSTGIPRQAGWNFRNGYEFEKDVEDGVLLLKIHGSLNWARYRVPVSDKDAEDMCAHSFVLTWGDKVPDYAGRKDIEPAIVFGDENKLTAEGPFLEMFIRFRNDLRKASRLTVVGYSFRDAHINAELTAFLNELPASKLCVIDPNPPLRNEFFGSLVLALSRTHRIEIVEATAANGLARVFK